MPYLFGWRAINPKVSQRGEKTGQRERDRYRLTARILGIFSPSSVQEEAGGSTLVLSAVSCEWNTERIWMLLFSNMRISLTRRLPGIYLNSC